MDLILWRHAQAHDIAPLACVPEAVSASGNGPDPLAALDLARRLTAKGEQQADRVGQWLHARLPATTRVLASPAQRTQQTAQALGRQFTVAPALRPGATVADVLNAAGWPGAADPVLIVGHQPTLGMLAARLLSGQDQAWAIRKGAVWWLRSRERGGQPEVTLLAAQSPDLL